MNRVWGGALLSSGILVLAGCIQSPVPEAGREEARLDSDPVVVAFIDTGINPYHVEFRLPGNDPRLPIQANLRDARTGELAQPLSLSIGMEYDEALRADAGILGQVEPGKLYHLVGTNILAITFDTQESAGPLLIDNGGHGTLVAGTARRTSPGIVIVAIEAEPRFCEVWNGEVCIQNPAELAAAEWVAEQPWIDILSLSFTNPGNFGDPDENRFAQVTRRMVESGKIVVAGAGNVPPPAVMSGSNAPPWVISVGGAQDDNRGAAVFAATHPDVAANYSWGAPSSIQSNGTREGSGTSLAAPRIAGVLAKAIAEVRATWGHRGGIVDGALAVSTAGERATVWDFRAALNASARVWNSTDWSPGGPREDPVETLIRSTAPVAAPAAQVGWGFVDNATAHEIAARVLSRDLALPAAKEGAHRAAVEGAYAARVQYWNAVPTS